MFCRRRCIGVTFLSPHFSHSGAGISFGTAGTASPVGFGAGAALGAQPLTALGGGTGGFGGGLGAGVSSGSAGTGGGIFGGSAAATPGAFGQRSTSTVAGTTTPTTFGFGSAGPAFGAQQVVSKQLSLDVSLLSPLMRTQQPASSTTGFGGFGAPSTASQNTAFRLGQPQPTGGGPAGGFAFGSGTVGGAAGSSGGGTGNPPFQPEKVMSLLWALSRPSPFLLPNLMSLADVRASEQGRHPEGRALQRPCDNSDACVC